MSKYCNIPKNIIYIENKSQDTIENAKYTKKIIDKLNIKRFILVTSDFHMERSLAIFNYFYKNYKIITI